MREVISLRSLAMSLIACLVLQGCAATTEINSTPKISASPSPATPSSTVSVNPASSNPTPTNIQISPDSTLMAEMVCQDLSDDLLVKMKSDFGVPTQSVQVDVGEGNTPGEIWTVVVLDSPADDAYQWGIRAFLTNAVRNPGAWTWIDLPKKNPWKAVEWDAARLVRAQSALTKAQQCLSEQSK